MLQRWMWTAAAAGTLGIAAQATAQDESINDYTLYGISNATGELVRYSFNNREFQAVDQVYLKDVGHITGIEGSAHIPGHLNIYGFWTNPDDNNTQMLYINSQSGEATAVGNGLGVGQVTGATIAGLDNSGNIDSSEGTVAGAINVNPNNSPNMELTICKYDGKTISHEDLLRATLGANGVYYDGTCHYIRFAPKGPGDQSGLTLDGAAYTIENNKAYLIIGKDMHVKLWNDHVHANGSAMGKWHLDVSETPFVTVRDETNGGVFALQTVESTEDTPVPFKIVDGKVIPEDTFAVKASVLGAAITDRGAYDMPVTLAVTAGSDAYQPFGSFTLPVDGNVNDGLNPRKFILPTLHDAGTPISISATSWEKVNSSFSGNANSHWTQYFSFNAATGTPQAKVLRNGDPAPNIPSFLDQNEILDFIRDYVDQESGTMVLDENQAIYLFELGTTDLSSSAADFQDLVVLITLAHNAVDLQENEDDDDAAGPSSRLLKVNHKTGGFEQVMTLDRVYDGLTVSSTGVFYATHGNTLYELDPIAQTETVVGNTAHSDVLGLEAAGPNFFGFTLQAGQLTPIDILTGEQVGHSVSVGATDLKTIVFINHQLFSSQYD